MRSMALVVAAVALLAAGCDGDSDPEGASAPTEPASPVTVTEVVTTAPPGTGLAEVCDEIRRNLPKLALAGSKWTAFETRLATVQADADEEAAASVQPLIDAARTVTNADPSKLDAWLDALEGYTKALKGFNRECDAA